MNNQLQSVDVTGSFCCVKLVIFIDFYNISDIQSDAYNAIDILYSIQIFNAVLYVFYHTYLELCAGVDSIIFSYFVLHVNASFLNLV